MVRTSNSDSRNSINNIKLNYSLAIVIENADLGLPQPHEIHEYGSALAFMCSHSLNVVQEAGQWSSTTSFCTKAFSTDLEDVPCVAKGVDPIQNSRLLLSY